MVTPITQREILLFVRIFVFIDWRVYSVMAIERDIKPLLWPLLHSLQWYGTRTVTLNMQGIYSHAENLYCFRSEGFLRVRIKQASRVRAQALHFDLDVPHFQ
jgi:hypothetical protein